MMREQGAWALWWAWTYPLAVAVRLRARGVGCQCGNCDGVFGFEGPAGLLPADPEEGGGR
jgi:hypothetical protein